MDVLTELEVRYMSVNEAAKQMGVSPNWIRILCRVGRVPGACKPDQAWLIPRDGVVKAVKQDRKLLRLNGDPSEAQTLDAVLRYLAYRRDAVVWAKRMNSGAGMLARRKGGPARWIEFGFPGCPDILGMMSDGRLLAIEAKAAGKYPTPQQKEFLARVTAAGGVAGVAWSIEDVIKILGDTAPPSA